MMSSIFDMQMKQTGADNDTSWYRKPTDTGVDSLFQSPYTDEIYKKKNILQGYVHRDFNVSSNRLSFMESMTEIVCTLEKNQFRSQIYETIICEARTKIFEKPIEKDTSTRIT